MKIVTVGAGDIPVKIKLANRIGSGWPDVVFNEPYYTAQLVSEGYSAKLDTMVPKRSRLALPPTRSVDARMEGTSTASVMT
jgi:hypothetical protein